MFCEGLDGVLKGVVVFTYYNRGLLCPPNETKSLRVLKEGSVSWSNLEASVVAHLVK